ncbi:hypothetical protein BJY00DRAFT_326804 [Aspergillus carlsbadensis]|nr:hypothetical protein BJY00DRAFT_326804 [Aspergillus carlsbadensis]
MLPLQLIAQTALISVSLAASCYFSDGTYGSREQQPCFPDQEVSSCCGISKTSGDENDYCLTSGLCLGQVSGYKGVILMNSCTDVTWTSDDCLHICPQSTKASHGIYVLPCPEKSNSHWCCSIDGSNCCNDAFRMDIGTLMFPENGSSGNWTHQTSVMNPPISTNAGASEPITNSDKATATATATVCPTVSSSTSASEGACESGTCPYNKIAVVGVSVGLGVALVISLALSVGALCFQRSAFKQQLEDIRGNFASAWYKPAPHAPAELSTVTRAELSNGPRTTLIEP